MYLHFDRRGILNVKKCSKEDFIHKAFFAHILSSGMYLLNSSVLYNICEHSQPFILKRLSGTWLRKKKKTVNKKRKINRKNNTPNPSII